MSAFLGWLGRQTSSRRRASRVRVDAGAALVIGAASGYTVEQVKPFIESLRVYHSGPVALVIHKADLDLATYLKTLGVEVLIPQKDSDANAPFSEEVYTGRYSHYVTYFAGLETLPTSVLLTDVRDVIFQGDPFQSKGSSEMHFFVEGNVSLGQHATRRWISDAFGRSVAEALSDSACICSGTMIGSGSAVEQLCRIVLVLAAIPRRGVARSFGMDQAAVNVAVHLGLSSGEVHENFGLVSTLGLVDASQVLVDKAGFICNPDGTQSAIVHQYDRHPALLESVRQRFGISEPSGRTLRQSLSNVITRASSGLARRMPEVR